MERKILLGSPDLQTKIHLGSISNGRAAIISQGDIAAHSLVPCLAQQTGLVSSQTHSLSLLTAGGLVSVPMSQQSQIFSQMAAAPLLSSTKEQSVITERLPVLSQSLTVIPERDPVFSQTFLKVAGRLPVMSPTLPVMSSLVPAFTQKADLLESDLLSHKPVMNKKQMPVLTQGPQKLVVKTELPEKYNFHNQVFLNQLQSFYDQDAYSDVIVFCENGSRRVHSLVVGAASSMMKHVFQDVAVRGFDCQLTILMPETTIEELDIQLKPVYGFADAVSSDNLNTFKIDFNKDAGIKEKNHVQLPLLGDSVSDAFDSLAMSSLLFGNNEKPSPAKRGRPPKESQYVYDHDDNLDYLDTFDEEFEISTKKRKRGRPPKKIKTEIEDEEFVMEPKIVLKEELNPDDEFGDVTPGKLNGLKVAFEQDANGLFCCQFSGCSFNTFVKASVLQHATHSHSPNGGFQESNLACARCGETWSNQDHYSKHLSSEICLGKGDRPYICENCGLGWYNLTNYTKHIEILASKDSLDPETRENLEKQNMICTMSLAARDQACSTCNLTFFSCKNRDVHMKKAHSPGTVYKCAKCDLSFTVHKEFTKHRKTVHEGDSPKKSFSCRIPGCTFDCDKRELLAGHVKTDHPEKDHICIDCGKNFSDRNKLLSHMAGKKCTPVNYDCTHCPRQFNRKRHMELHVLFKHSQDRPFSCEECGKRFKTRHCVNIHLRSHGIGGFSWCCEECGKTFNQISAYHVHLKVHSNVRDFACETCGMTFKLKHSLKKHQLVHKTEFGHTCDFCGKKFKRSDNLINHRRRHTGEHPYRCDKCNWTGPDSSSYIHHKKKHANTAAIAAVALAINVPI